MNFRLTDESLEKLRVEEIPERILASLGLLKDQEFRTESIFLEAVQVKIGQQHLAEYQKYILKYAIERYSADDILDFLEDGQSLENADLRWSILRGISLFKARLKGANLYEADLSDTDLRGSSFEGANLQSANLMGADLTRANLVNANLENANLDRTILQRANLSNACFKNASLYYSIIKNADISGADFTGADLREANLNGVEGASSAKFDHADLTEARVRYTGLDLFDLKAMEAKGGSSHPERGWKFNTFRHTKISWTEFMGPHFTWLLTPFRWLVVPFQKRFKDLSPRSKSK